MSAIECDVCHLCKPMQRGFMLCNVTHSLMVCPCTFMYVCMQVMVCVVLEQKCNAISLQYLHYHEMQRSGTYVYIYIYIYTYTYTYIYTYILYIYYMYVASFRIPDICTSFWLVISPTAFVLVTSQMALGNLLVISASPLLLVTISDVFFQYWFNNSWLRY